MVESLFSYEVADYRLKRLTKLSLRRLRRSLSFQATAVVSISIKDRSVNEVGRCDNLCGIKRGESDCGRFDEAASAFSFRPKSEAVEGFVLL